MWLLNTTTLTLHQFQSDPPPYAILSHTWGEQEVLFQEIGTSECETKLGYQKIKGCCALAKTDGLQYAWVDTCSIDKRSSTELSEAINSMFRWYSEAAVCYAYLADVDSNSQLAKSRYWTRGWTLQELIAPSRVVFFDKNWTELDSKQALGAQITRITGIPYHVLDNPASIRRVSLAARMSWASQRTTPRVEDRSYCLMGLCGVNMPLLYGEGIKSFQRLQLQILAQSDDLSLLAWRSVGAAQDAVGVLASCPAEFEGCSGIEAWGETSSQPISVTNLGLSVSIPITRVNDEDLVVVLNCTLKGKSPGILITKVGSRYFRRRPNSVITMDHRNFQNTAPEAVCLSIDQHDSGTLPRRVMVQFSANTRIKPREAYNLVHTCKFDNEHLTRDLRSHRQTATDATFTLTVGKVRLALLFKNDHGDFFALACDGNEE